MTDYYGSLSSAIHALYDYQSFDDNLKIWTIITNELNPHKKLKYLKLRSNLENSIKKLRNIIKKPNYPEIVKAVGFKITVSQAFKDVPDFWESLQTTSPDKIIFLKRNNLLERYLSYKTATQSGIWHSNKPIKKSTPTKIDYTEFCNFVDQCRFFDELIEQHRCESELDWLDISYEELLVSKTDVLKKIFTFLEVPYSDQTDGKIVKLSHGTTNMRISN